MAIIEEFLDTRTQASEVCARHIARALERRLEESSVATFIASGGSTPEACYRLLASTDLNWNQIRILPSDDRCVPADHDASNEGMIRRLLLADCANEAELVSLIDDTLLPEDQCSGVEEKLATITRPIAIALLGIGTDGHFASLFADGSRVQDGLDPNYSNCCMLVQTAASPYPRITLTMSLLLDCSEILLFFFGDSKRDVYEQAKMSDNKFPVSRLLCQQRTPVRVVWAP